MQITITLDLDKIVSVARQAQESNGDISFPFYTGFQELHPEIHDYIYKQLSTTYQEEK
jgi:hypothetical protein